MSRTIFLLWNIWKCKSPVDVFLSRPYLSTWICIWLNLQRGRLSTAFILSPPLLCDEKLSWSLFWTMHRFLNIICHKVNDFIHNDCIAQFGYRKKSLSLEIWFHCGSYTIFLGNKIWVNTLNIKVTPLIIKCVSFGNYWSLICRKQYQKRKREVTIFYRNQRSHKVILISINP